jgi:transcriptional regulator with XRE-family HTH domain
MSVSRPFQPKLGAKLRQLRVERGLSVRALAARSGFSPSFISQVEAEIVSPSIASLEKIVTQLGTTLGQFFSAIEAAPRLIVRRHERAAYASEWSRSHVAVLTDAAAGRKVSIVEVTVEPDGLSGRRPVPSGQETCLLVLRGALALTVETETEVLEAGDTAYLVQGLAFMWANHGEETAVLLIVTVSSGYEGTVPLAANGDEEGN